MKTATQLGPEWFVEKLGTTTYRMDPPYQGSSLVTLTTDYDKGRTVLRYGADKATGFIKTAGFRFWSHHAVMHQIGYAIVPAADAKKIVSPAPAQPQPGRAYTIKELVALKDEYLDPYDTRKGEWWCTPGDNADGELSRFINWLNIKENTP